MFNVNKLVTIAGLFALSAQAVFISEPEASDITQCNEIKLTFSGSPPFTASVWKGCDSDSTATDALAQYHTNNTYVYWKVNVAEGESIMFGITDATGDYDWTDDYKVGDSSDSSCVGVSPSFSSGNGTSTTSTTTTTAYVGNAGGLQASTSTYSATTSTASVGAVGALGGALSNFAPRVELAAFVVLGSSMAAMLF